ncbi:hypothetical protein [Francisella sp. SYW-9]|uniref:hypothetical protein n=1 Tax=Francisella sp. SYW-9 TaxID=2610888 RepID=UPI00123D17C8|nr:hypothetical protein [Francisella sp. SYW-9]
MADKDDINDLIVLNAIKGISQDKLIDLLYSEKFNSIFKKNAILENMLPKNEELADDSSLKERWQESLIEGVLPNTYPTIISQSIRLKIVPFDEKLAIDESKAVEVNSYYIQDLQLSLETTGFKGSIDFVYPYQTGYDNKLMDIITQGLPFLLEISIKQEFFIEKYQKEFIEENGDLSNEEIKFTAYAGNLQKKETIIRSPEFSIKSSALTKIDGLYKIEFCDALSFFWKQLNPVCIYSGQSYDKIFQEQNTPFDKVIKLSFDTSSDQVLKQKLPFICMNCQESSGANNFYSYVQYILQQYNLILVYNYSDNEYIVTSDYDGLVSKAKVIKSIFIEDKQKIQEIKHLHKKPYLTHKSIINLNSNCADKQQIKVTEFEDMPKTVEAFKQDSVTEHDLSNLFKLKTDSCQTKLKNNFATSTIGLEIQAYSMPSSYSVLPLQNNLKFSAKEWGLILDKKDKYMVLHKVDLSFEKTPLYSNNNKRHPLAYEDKQEGKVEEYKISFKFEEEALESSELPLMFNCNSRFYLYNKELWPQCKKYNKPPTLNLTGHIYTTDTDYKNSTYTSELFNYSVDASKSITANENYDSSSEVFSLDPNLITRPRYQIKVAPQLWTKLTPKGKQFVPANMVLASYSNMLFYLKSGTEVELNVFEEYANLTKVKKYIAPQEMLTSGDKEQSQGIIFEDRKEQRTVMHNSYKPGDKTSSFKIIHSPKDKGSPSNLEMNNQSFKISVDCK